MADGVNKAILIGYVGKNVKFEDRGTYKQAIVNLATTKTYKKNGAKESKTVWHLLYFYGALAEVVSSLIEKGAMIYIEGSIDNKSWQDETTGQYKSMSKIIVSEFKLLESKKEKPIPGNSYESNEGKQASFNRAASQGSTIGGINFNGDYLEDEIPF